MVMKLAQGVYDHSPIWIQNLLLSGYGWKLRKARYGGAYTDYLAHLQRMESASRDELRELQAQELRRLLNHAARHVPWYRTAFADYGSRLSQIDPDNLGRSLPTLSKDELRAHSAALVADNVDTDDLHVINTSGTTGTPLTIRATNDALRKNYAFFERFLHAAGVSSRDRSATFAGRMLIPQTQKGPPYWRLNRAMNTLLCSSYHISDATAASYLEQLARFRPTFIDAYPSAVFTLAQCLADRGGNHQLRPNAIVTSSETLLDHQRTLIERTFGCRVFDQYGSAEMAACITQCEHGSYHVNPEYGIVEIIREDGQPAAPGETGELVCTGFLNHAMPMIRYRIGDSAVATDRTCECGRNWPVIDRLLGRVDDVIVTTDGRRVGRLDPLFKGLTGIKETQIVQLGYDRMVVNIVPDRGYTAEIAESLIASLKLRVGQDMQVELCLMDQIPRTSSGKFRAVVSKIKPTGPDENTVRHAASG